MNNRRTILSSAACVVFACTATLAQSVAPRNLPTAQGATQSAARVIAALARLDHDVIVYRSLGDFEEGRKLSHVSLTTFEKQFDDVCAVVAPLLEAMPAGKLKNDLSNSLDSYRDGLFRWKQTDAPRVVNIRNLSYATPDLTPAEAALRSTLPYTVAIHWRQAHDYLARAERLSAESRTTFSR